MNADAIEAKKLGCDTTCVDNCVAGGW